MNECVSGLILAGGRGQRLGGKDKGLVLLNGRPMISMVIDRFAPQVQQLAISANRNMPRYAAFDYPVLSDANANFDGPLAGMQAGLHWCPSEFLAVTPCDSPLLPVDLVAKLYATVTCDESDIALATNHGKRQPVFALLRSTLTHSLDNFLASGERKIGLWYESERISLVEFTNDEAFTNINTTKELAEMEALVS